MKPRTFRMVSIQRATSGQRETAAEIKCGSCGATDHVAGTAKTSSASAEMVSKKWKQQGWVIGAGEHADRCPKCAEKIRATKPQLKIVAKETPMTFVAAEPPRQMERDDRRIIFSKLNDVYLDEKRGYDSGWSDKRIAEDLNVPRAWVGQVREENFGPAKDSEDTRALLASVVEVNAKVEAVDKAMQEAAKLAAGLKQELEALNRQAADIRKAVA